MTQFLRVGYGLKGCERVDLGTFHSQRALGGRGQAHMYRVEAFFGIGGGSAKGKATGKGCGKCKGKGGVECQGCKGTGKNKKNGNMFERWKCFDCQGFGLVKCPNCGAGGLTPEQRGER